METTERQTADGLIDRAAAVLRNRDPSFAQSAAAPQGGEQASARTPCDF